RLHGHVDPADRAGERAARHVPVAAGAIERQLEARLRDRHRRRPPQRAPQADRRRQPRERDRPGDGAQGPMDDDARLVRRWQAAVMKSGSDTIGGAGCALTSTAMLLNYYGSSLSPAQLNSCLGGAADPIEWKAVPACTGNMVTGGDRIDFTWNDLDALLASGR